MQKSYKAIITSDGILADRFGDVFCMEENYNSNRQLFEVRDLSLDMRSCLQSVVDFHVATESART